MRSSTTLRRPFLGFALLLTLSCGGGEGGGSTEPTPNPTPTISAMVRDSATAGVTPFSVIIGGANFMPGVVASFDGSPRSTNRQSGSALDFLLQAADLATPGDHEIRLKNPEPGGGPSAATMFHVLAQPPVPVLDSLSPDTVVAGTAGPLLVKAFGHGFVPGAVLKIDGTSVITTRISDTLLQTQLATGTMGTPGSITLTVYKAGPGGGTSAGRTFVLLPPPPGPAITSISPDSVQVGPDTIPVLIRGTAFAAATLVDFNNQGSTHSVVPTSVTDTSLVANLDRTWLSSLGNLAVRVHATTGTSAYFYAETYNPLPAISSFAPDTLDGAQLADTFIVTGTGFVDGMTTWLTGGLPVTSVTYLDYWHLRVIVPQATLQAGGHVGVRIHDPLEYHFSDSVQITIRSPAPVVDSMDRDSILSGSPATWLGIWGRGFSWRGSVTVDGVPRQTNVQSDQVASVLLTAAELAAADTLSIGFQNPAPAVGPSNSLPLRVLAANPPPVIDSIVPGRVLSDSGVQTIAVHGRGFLPGSQVEIREGPYSEYTPFPLDTAATTWVSESLVTAMVPAAVLNLGWRLDVMVRAPQPTAAPSNALTVPVRTSGIRSIDSLGADQLRYMVWDSVRGVIYAVSEDFNSPQTLVALDPVTGAKLRQLPLDDFNARFTFDDGNAHLYVLQEGGHTVSRVDLASWTLDWTISMGEAPGGAPRLTPFVIPLPGTPGSFAVAPNADDGSGTNVFTVYDDSVPRAWHDTLGIYARYGAMFGDTVVVVTYDTVFAGVIDSADLRFVEAIPLAQISPQGGVFLSRDRMAFSGRLVDLRTGATVAQSPDLIGRIVPALTSDHYFVQVGGPTTYPFFSVAIRRIDATSGSTQRTVGFEMPYQTGAASLTLDGTGVFFIGVIAPDGSFGLRLNSVLSD